MITIKHLSIYILVAIFLCYEMAVQVSPEIMTSQLMHDLHISTFGLGIMSGCYFYTYAIMQIPSGLLYDKYQIKYIVSIALLVCAVGTILFSSMDNMYVGCLARLMMGAGSAFAFVGVLTVVSDLFPKQYFSLFAGITQLIAAAGAMGGGILLGKIINMLGWRTSMLYMGIFGFALAVAIILLVGYDFNRSKTKHVVTHSHFKRNFLVVSKNPQTWYLGIYSCLLWAPMATFASLWGVPYLIHQFNMSSTTAIYICSYMWIGIAVASPLIGVISEKIKTRKALLCFAACIGFISSLCLLYIPTLHYFTIILCVLVAGIACSGQVLSFAVVRDITPKHSISTAMGFNNMSVVISGAIFQPLIGKLLDTHLSFYHSLGLNLYTFALSIIPLFYLFGILVSLFLIKDTFYINNTNEQFVRVVGNES